MALACLDGEIRDRSAATIPVTDDGLLRGDGVFEVVRLYGGRPFALDEHLERMGGSAARLRLPVDLDALRDDVERLLAAEDAGDAKLRLLVTRGGRRIALIEDLPAQPATIALATVEFAPVRTLDGVKSLSYAANMLAARLAAERGADDALLATPHGRLLEGSTSAFFAVLGGELVTPPLTDHILDSITRRRVLAIADVVERPLARDDVGRMEEAFLASTLREAQGIHAIDQTALPAPGPRTREVAARLRERIASELAAGSAP